MESRCLMWKIKNKTIKKEKRMYFSCKRKDFRAQSEKDNYTGCYIITALLREK